VHTTCGPLHLDEPLPSGRDRGSTGGRAGRGGAARRRHDTFTMRGGPAPSSLVATCEASLPLGAGTSEIAITAEPNSATGNRPWGPSVARAAQMVGADPAGAKTEQERAGAERPTRRGGDPAGNFRTPGRSLDLSAALDRPRSGGYRSHVT
jgi:hypothetical protein